ncbi:MAG: GNAT family N-acetyltransferase [Gammaproteobacteria bacterium]|nr:GNAT family N-acetyltransferase [Gammaproteobacteria bacterium]
MPPCALRRSLPVGCWPGVFVDRGSVCWVALACTCCWAHCTQQPEEGIAVSGPEVDRLSLRSDPRPGELGWLIHRHGVIYAEEFGWDWRFEGVVAGIVSEIIAGFDPQHERCWLAELDGVLVGCCFLVRVDAEVSKLRLLLVEPAARGRGIAWRLVTECLAFARAVGYRKITLWTNDPLVAARRLYQRAGFRMVHSEPAEQFGHQMMSETWELDLASLGNPAPAAPGGRVASMNGDRDRDAIPATRASDNRV